MRIEQPRDAQELLINASQPLPPTVARRSLSLPVLRCRGARCGEGFSGCAAEPGRGQLGEDSIGLGEPVAVFDPHDAKSPVSEVGIPFAVALDGACVNLAVEFDHEREGAAVEVRDEWTDRMLSTPLDSEAAARSHSVPERPFGRGHAPTK